MVKRVGNLQFEAAGMRHGKETGVTMYVKMRASDEKTNDRKPTNTRISGISRPNAVGVAVCDENEATNRCQSTDRERVIVPSI
jgi:hypothetical protein